ncbi:MAG TPA: hypothetical protein VMW09_03390 [Desulfatiglandales bacterium]|nr:hypothetical protein [Desulfatiglandales bacterium]
MENRNQVVPFGTQMPSLYGGDPAIVAAAETAKARIQSAYIMAIQKPRTPDQARQKILRMCDNPEFAEKVEYSKPIGNTSIKDLSIRFAEAAMAEWGNILSEVQMIYDDDNVRRIRVSVIDLETNTQFSRDITLKKTIERKSKKGREDDYISERKNSYGQTVYILQATDDEMLIKESAMASKFIRTEGLRLLPAGIKQEAKERSRATLASRDKSDPDAAKKRILDAFAGLNIWPNDIKKYIGHSVDTLSPSEIVSLRTIYAAIDGGESTWADYINKKESEGKDPEHIKPDEDKPSTKPLPTETTTSVESEIPIVTTPPEFAKLVKAEAKKDFEYVPTDKDGMAHDNLSAYIEMVSSNNDSTCEAVMNSIVSTNSFAGFWSNFLQGNWKKHFEGKLPEVKKKAEPTPEAKTDKPIAGNGNADNNGNAFDTVDWKANRLKGAGLATYFHTNKKDWDGASEETKASFQEKWGRVYGEDEPFPVQSEEKKTVVEKNPEAPVDYAASLREYYEKEPDRLLEACHKLNYDNVVIPMGKQAQKDLYDMFQKVSE